MISSISSSLYCCLLAVVCLAVWLRLQDLTRVSLSFDESCSWKVSQRPVDEMLDAISRDAHPPLYYFLLKALTKCCGDSVIVLRGFSVLLGTATVLLSFLFVKTAFDQNAADVTLEEGRREPAQQRRVYNRDIAAVFAALLVACSGLQIEMSLQARPYTLGTCLALLSAIFLIRGTNLAGTWRDWVGFTLSTTLLSFTHYYCLFTVAGLYLFAAGSLLNEVLRTGWQERLKRQVVAAVISLWSLQLVWLFWIPTFLFQRGRTTEQLWMSPLDWETVSTACWKAITVGHGAATESESTGIAIFFWCGTVLGLLMLRNRGGRLAALCAGVPLVATVIYSVSVRNILGVKYLAFGEVFLLISWALIVGQIPRRWLQIPLGLLFLSLIIYGGWKHSQAQADFAKNSGVRQAVEYMEQWRKADEPVIIGSPFVHPIVQKYAADADGIYTIYGGDHRGNILSGPALRVEDYRNIERHWLPPTEEIWTIDVYGMFQPDAQREVRLPQEWELVRQEEFREKFGLPCILAVREYRRHVD